MKVHDATEQSYKNGYEAGKKDAVVHSAWRFNKDASGTCKNCHRTTKNAWDYDSHMRYCPDCGAKMDLEV